MFNYWLNRKSKKSSINEAFLAEIVALVKQRQSESPDWWNGFSAKEVYDRYPDVRAGLRRVLVFLEKRGDFKRTEQNGT